MQATDTFKTVINNHLKGLAEKYPLFAETLKKPAKNIDDCATYILNQVKKSGQNGFADEEIFAMAVHYYDEDTIEVGKPVNGNVVVNHHIEPTKREVQVRPVPETKKAPKKVKKESAADEQIYLF